MNHPECILTGCYFYSPQEVKHVKGDLHAVGDCLILNCATTAGGSPQWFHGQPPHGEMVVAPMQSIYFERRGVIVFTRVIATFNDAAERYLKGDDRARRV